ncbi:Transmembrane protein [Senna tora]|uniref:Transmembrane protein n=1 Tax=Senna tora TaxID=362788 RepID=A0A834TT28_9FABA|nr:Transmembrane protein [Senna tora]
MSAPPQGPSIGFWGILSDSKRIINAHSRHFLTLSIIFLLPLSFSLIVYPTLHRLIHRSLITTSHILLHHCIKTNALFFSLLYSLFVFAFSLCAVATITYSVFHGFYGRPVKLVSAVKSIFASFFPLLVTVVVSQFIICSISLVFGVFSFLVVRGIELLIGIRIDYSSPYFIGFSVVLVLAFLFVLVNLQVNWTLLSVVVVAESSWGLKALRRSVGLIKGMKGVALSSLMFFGVFTGMLVWSSLVSTKNWGFVMQIVVASIFLMLILLYNAAANTVMYVYCKAIHGEVAEEFAWEYVRFPFDDDEGKIPHVVSIVHE